MARVADKIEFEADENGWEMYIYPQDGGDPEVWNIHGITGDFILQVDKSIGSYLRDGLTAARQHAMSLMQSAYHDTGYADAEAFRKGDPSS